MTLRIPDPVLGPWSKSVPPRLHGLPLSAVPAAGARLSEFGTPLLTVHEAALAHNETTVLDWAHAQGMKVAPHGKTTMAPALWQRLLDAGSWGITVATPWQAGVAIDAGVERVLLAGAVADAAGAARLGAQLAARPGLRLLVWADALDTVAILADALADAVRPVEVLVELGGAHGRTGVRTVAEGEEIARAIAAAPGLRLAGVAGYEGPFGPDRSEASVAAVDAYLRRMGELFEGVLPLIDHAERPILTAGGSAWPDRVAAVLAPYTADAEVILRSGAFQIHDDGFYARMGPFGSVVPTAPLRSAMHAWARVVSRPEADLALLDAGRRDVPFDLDLPVPQGVEGEVTALNDQHAFLRTADGARLAVGDVVRLGLSHPCTAFDKWRVVPVIDDPDAEDPLVIGAVATWF
ncbi:D-serine deaminase-like pyridoxal phosphate-dependent protein [Microbacterium resistens]|uniref:D-serine deaminase-like pyridoxal phosphate-dependent protein n=1 Tax=Microbacterium resistens TaxID=156977 RepID=A0ABU1SEQ1_9MICO|nr:alanine racemase [Microbacterium resistens]MDR6868054.1 D-serine deaminase-like pyridoxal phosphate-dependent protein [Microbacterium resistens]